MAKTQPQVHFILQGKGGVGKSVTARLLTEYLMESAPPVIAFDADGNNQSFAAVPALKAKALDLEDPENPDEINTRVLDEMTQAIIKHKGAAVVDVGAGTYRPLVGYAANADLFAGLSESFGVKVFIHTIVTGGESRDDTVSNFADLAERFGGGAHLVVWLNNYWGPIVEDGMPDFDKWKTVKPHMKHVVGVIVYPPMKKDTFLVDFRQMMKDNITFAEVLGDGLQGRYGFPVTSRMRMLKKKFWEQLDGVFARSEHLDETTA